MIRFTLPIVLWILISCGAQENKNENAEEGNKTHELAVWNYEGHRGPKQWASIHYEYSACGDGRHQSPININGVKSANHQISFNYIASHEVILNNGHTIELLYDEGSTIQFDNKSYQLLQFHFHTPSEHHYYSREFPLEMHMVHRSMDTTYLVLGIMFDEGAESKFLSRFIVDAPEKVEEMEYHKNIDINEVFPSGSLSCFFYQGSFTTPPCTEGVRWVLLKENLEASALQIKVLRSIEGRNVRPIQALNDREVEEFSFN